jgi:LacI family transcriptional regulator
MPRSRKISQTQLAHELGLSQALVSLVLNGRKQNISPETYDRIWQHAVKRGYHPKGMRLSSTPDNARQRTVGFILRAPMRLSTIGSYFGHVQNGLHTALQTKGISTVFLGSEDQLDTEQISKFFPAGHTLQGVVLFAEVAQSFLLELRSYERRIVAVSARYSGLTHSVIGNESQALNQLIEHLHGLGHRRSGWLGGNQGMSRHEARFTAFKGALNAAGLNDDVRYHIALPQTDRDEGAEAVHRLIKHSKRRDFPTAFVAYNSLVAQGAARAFLRADWQVPEDVSIAGADTHRPEGSDTPTVTGAGSDPASLGAAAARLILESTGETDEAFIDLMLPSKLVIGESTGPVS